MRKITDREVADVVRYSDTKIIVVEKRPMVNGAGFKANYFIFDIETLEKEVITKNAYLMKKFGSSFKKISATVANTVQCEAVILPDRSVFVLFPNGQCGYFDAAGEILWNDTLTYNGHPVHSLALDGSCVWCCCKEENCVIRYMFDNKINVDIRIGAKEAKTFILPTSVSADEDCIYVCCNNAKLRSIHKNDLIVSDVGAPILGLQKFYRFGSHAFICTNDGAYID